jgi:hypothetical protein
LKGDYTLVSYPPAPFVHFTHAAFYGFEWFAKHFRSGIASTFFLVELFSTFPLGVWAKKTQRFIAFVTLRKAFQ